MGARGGDRRRRALAGAGERHPGYGQIDLLVATLVLGDLSRPAGARGAGVGVGLAAALKLTPLIFIPYLVLCGRRRAAATAAAVFTGSIALAFLALPADAARYWSGRLFLDPGRVGGAADTADQSARGLLARLDPHLAAHPGPGPVIALGLLAALGLVLAGRAGRRGDEAAGVSLTALTALLVSPISWTHHWTLAVPAVVLLGIRARQRRSLALNAAFLLILAIAASWLPEWVGPSEPRGAVSLLTSDPYVLPAGAAILIGALAVLRDAGRARLRRRSRTAGASLTPCLRPATTPSGPRPQ